MDEVMRIQLAAHEGVVSALDLREAGVSERTVRTAVRQGQVTRVRRGAYVEAQAYLQAGPESRYRMRVAAVLRSRPRDNASHHAALAVHGLPLYGCDLRRIDTCGPVRGTTVAGALVVHPRAGCALGSVGDVRAVSPADAIVQTTAVTGLNAGVVAADAALHRGSCTVDALQEAADRLTTHANVRLLASLADLVEPETESPGESLTRLILRMAGFAVRSQVRIADERGKVLARVDLLVGERVVVEFDGEVKYTGAGPDVLFREKQREDRLRELGYEVVRVVWADLADPERLLNRVRAALARAARRTS